MSLNKLQTHFYVLWFRGFITRCRFTSWQRYWRFFDVSCAYSCMHTDACALSIPDRFYSSIWWTMSSAHHRMHTYSSRNIRTHIMHYTQVLLSTIRMSLVLMHTGMHRSQWNEEKNDFTIHTIHKIGCKTQWLRTKTQYSTNTQWKANSRQVRL